MRGFRDFGTRSALSIRKFARFPSVTVNHRIPPFGTSPMYKKILIPTDGSLLANAAARAGIAFASEVGAEVVGLFVAPDYMYPIYVDTIPSNYPTQEGHETAMRKAGEMYLAEMEKGAADAGLVYSSVTLFSDTPAEKIVDTAKDRQCDLIFMGSHGRSGLRQLLLGSVTGKVLATCDVPVLVYRSSREAALA
jgi:nucleotide-binding universal stress UspA family protein